MIRAFERLLSLILAPVAGASSLYFVAPDKAWRDFINGLDPTDGPRLNAHLVELVENRTLRSNDTRIPARVDCHYLISAWSREGQIVDGLPSQNHSQVESQLLYSAARALILNAPVVPSRLLGGEAPAAAAGWAEYVDHKIPLALMPPPGFTRLPEFWGTQGDGHRWKPVLQVVATLPVVGIETPAGPPVTTIVSDYPLANGGEVHVMVAGTVRLDGNPQGGAQVSVIDSSNTTVRRTVAGTGGRFSVSNLAPGRYRFSAVWFDRSTINELDVPSGGYDLTIN